MGKRYNRTIRYVPCRKPVGVLLGHMHNGLVQCRSGPNRYVRNDYGQYWKLVVRYVPVQPDEFKTAPPQEGLPVDLWLIDCHNPLRRVRKGKAVLEKKKTGYFIKIDKGWYKVGVSIFLTELAAERARQGRIDRMKKQFEERPRMYQMLGMGDRMDKALHTETPLVYHRKNGKQR